MKVVNWRGAQGGYEGRKGGAIFLQASLLTTATRSCLQRVSGHRGVGGGSWEGNTKQGK